MIIQQMIEVARNHSLAIYEHQNGVILIEFPDIDGISPMLISADEGETWCPEASNGKTHLWGGNISLHGKSLEKEINDMYASLKIGVPDKMLTVVKELQSINDCRIVSRLLYINQTKYKDPPVIENYIQYIYRKMYSLYNENNDAVT